MSNKNYISIDEAIGKMLNQVYEASKTKTCISGVPTGFRDLDNITLGLQRGDLIVLGGRVAMGKTALALSIARNIAGNNANSVLYFSLEMSTEQLVNRIMTMQSHVETEHIKSAQLSDKEWESLIESANSISNTKMIIDDTPGNNVDAIRESCMECMGDGGIDLVVIDYLQLITGGREYSSRQEEITEITRKLKALAKEINAPVVVLSQLSRCIEQRDNHRPLLEDLRESGAVGQDADVVMLIYRDNYYHKDSEYGNLTEVSIAKQRNGKCGTVYLDWNPRFCEFNDYCGKLPNNPSVSGIIEMICGEYGVSKDDIFSKKRNAEIIQARQVVMYLCRKYTNMSLEEIGKAVGKKDHTSVMSGISKIRQMISDDEEFANMISRFEAKFDHRG